MKNTAVATTTASGAAVSSSRITAVQSVYIAARQVLVHHPVRAALACFILAPLAVILGLAATQLERANLELADVRFENCQPAAGGAITCDTRPEGNTLLNDEAARFGLLDGASPGWDEFDPYADDDAMLGGSQG
jgi:hypothetical protein